MNYELILAAATSNAGKTTVTMGLLRALRDRSLKVQPYKCGPDYIDTMFHRMASGRESINLDGFMSGRGMVEQFYHHYGLDSDVRVIEGVMGLFDGYDHWKGSTAEIAQWLDVPIVLLVNAQSAAYSVAPLLFGFKNFWPKGEAHRPPLAGVIFNKVASERHFQFLREACEEADVECFGYVSRNPELVIPGRHLGLTITAQEQTERLIQLAAQEVEKHVDLDRLLKVIGGYTKQKDGDKNGLFDIKSMQTTPRTNPIDNIGSQFSPFLSEACGRRILVARDEAFNFTYRTHLDALEAMGDVNYFSPLHDTVLPPCDWLYLPGGYPELFATQLSANRSMRAAVRDYAERGGHIYAECGGFMYLCQDIDGAPMCGVLPMKATMKDARLHLGYRQMEWGGITVRGHEFHYSTVLDEPLPDVIEVLCLQHSATGTAVDTPIYRYKNVIAGYTHWGGGSPS